jgi:hypothetical protein
MNRDNNIYFIKGFLFCLICFLFVFSGPSLVRDLIPTADKKYSVGTEALRFNTMATDDLMVDGYITQSGTSYDGASETPEGIKLDASGNVTLYQELTVTGESNFTGKLRLGNNIDLGSHYISGDGASSGLRFPNDPNDAVFSGDISTPSNITCAIVEASSTAYGYVLKVCDPATPPSTASGFAWIYVDEADGDLKVKFGDGTVKTLATD